MRLIFLGPPGAGKGTMSRLLDERLKVKHLSSGDLLRESVRRQDEMGRKAQRRMQSGGLVPDEVVTGLILRTLEPFSIEESFVLDGFPRTVEQAKALDEVLAQRAQAPVDLAVDFEMSPEKVIDRLAGRRICEACGANFHVKTLPPRREGMCDRCGGRLMVRDDDEPGTIVKRLAVYQEQTEPLLLFYRRQGKLRAVSGELEIEEQYRQLLRLLQREGLTG